MANQQVYQAYPQNKGTLIPGQTISVNNYTVQVERYLSQGGFAHVYLVRTPTPVYNTTHHVLKRIAVANESMLTEVKKEVDIMRLLKGHPNIVHLIDAAWHKLPNGTFEVFILMEYCPGGGIIDMMNRRLRERLTEAEILQIFVDVCEGVAYMHNSRPPLLHRDLKVENILQSSPTSFKLCDFGSATTVSNPPTNMQEIRALEADLNRHTTLQYRAPEMVDVYSKRPVNEKSDVWALGVLLYKLCYYTTPFEEHGPLAILNVQYRIPPYPIYSQDMNMLIASMLREHGAQRPTVFELLNHVHRLRGTKSKFSYNVPVPPPLLPRSQAHAKPFSSPNPLDGIVGHGMPPAQPAISLYDPKSAANPPALNQGIQARDKVLEAIAPMRRGRPTTSQGSSSRPSSPQKNTQIRQKNHEQPTDWSDNGFEAEQDKAWKAATEKTSARGDASADGWVVGDSDKKTRKERPPGFGDDFGEKLWGSSDPNSAAPLPPRLSPRPNINMNVMKSTDAPVTPLVFSGTSRIRPKQDRLVQNRDKDAFEGLGLMTSSPKSAPTLGEARKLRTGLATMSTPVTQDNIYRDTGRSNATSDRPSPSPQTKYLSTTPFQPQSVSPVPTPGTSSSAFYRPSPSPSGASPSPSTTTDGLPIESRFPSLEELDAQFNPSAKPSANALYPSSVNDASSSYTPQMTKQAGNRSQYSSRTSYIGTPGMGGNLLKPSLSPNVSHSVEGVRSEQVTGIAMREQKESRKPDDASIGSSHSLLNRGHPTGNDVSLVSLKEGNSIPRPMAVRKHRSSVTMKPDFTNGKVADREGFRAVQSSSNDSLVPPKLPPRPSASASSTPPRDWLTGEDYEGPKPVMPSDVPMLRESPSKRASFIETSNFVMPSSATAQHVLAPERLVDEPQSADLSPTVSKFKRSFPAIDKIDTQQSQSSFSSGLTDNWSPVAPRKDVDVDSSSADEGPEEPRSTKSVAQKRHSSRAKGRQGRQSSVHELVHQYGGGVGIKEIEKERERPLGLYNINDSKPQKALGLAPPPATLDLDRKTPSPTANMTHLTSTTPNRSPHLQAQAISDNPQPPINAAKSPSSARSRPQSMFIFPSKSADSSASPSTTSNLMPPQEPKPRATRRTSISDMVQRYEAIGGAAKSSSGVVPAGPPSPIHRPVSAKLSSVSAENGRIQKGFPEPIRPITSKISMSNDTSSRSGGDPLKPRTTTHELVRQTTTGLSRSPTKGQRKFTSEKDRPAPGSSPTPDKTILRSRRISVKAEPPPIASSHARSETPTNSTQVSLSSESFRPPSSPRKPAMSVEEDSSSKPEEPERPYQGVGRLIDQWQKKSAEAEQGRPAPPGKRTDLLPKRAGFVRGEDR